jgi:hypothetical protein
MKFRKTLASVALAFVGIVVGVAQTACSDSIPADCPTCANYSCSVTVGGNRVSPSTFTGARQDDDSCKFDDMRLACGGGGTTATGDSLTWTEANAQSVVVETFSSSGRIVWTCTAK